MSPTPQQTPVRVETARHVLAPLAHMPDAPTQRGCGELICKEACFAKSRRMQTPMSQGPWTQAYTTSRCMGLAISATAISSGCVSFKPLTAGASATFSVEHAMSSLCLTPEELVSLTKKKRYSAQAKALRGMGIEHRHRPDGSIAVNRGYYEALSNGTLQDGRFRKQEKTQPRWDAL